MILVYYELFTIILGIVVAAVLQYIFNGTVSRPYYSCFIIFIIIILLYCNNRYIEFVDFFLYIFFCICQTYFYTLILYTYFQHVYYTYYVYINRRVRKIKLFRLRRISIYTII